MAKALNILAIVTLVEMMIYIGLGASVTDIVNTVKNWRLVVRGIVARVHRFPALASVCCCCSGRSRYSGWLLGS